MSTIKFENLNTWETFKDFLKAYHPNLQEQRSFPPLGIQKALHTAAPIFGYNSAHEMAHALEGEKQPMPVPARHGLGKDEVLNALEFVNKINAAVESESVNLSDVAEAMGLDMPEVYNLLDLTETLYNQVLRGELVIQSPAEKKDDRIEVVTVSVTTLETDHATLDETYTKVFREMDAATEFVRDLVRTKASNNDRTGDEILECQDITGPEDEDREAMGEEDVLEWVVANNGIYDLMKLIGYLDYELTTVTVDQDWI